MNILSPQNIFSKLLVDNLPANLKSNVKYFPSALISTELKKQNDCVGLIPTIDIIKNNDLFVSKSFGISFEGALCNSYIYYNSAQKEFKELGLLGDVSSVEVVLSKILFQEIYDSSVEVKILTDESKANDQNLIITGDLNFKSQKFSTGISLAEEIIESLSLPFVNYIFASKEESLIQQLNENLAGVSASIYDEVEEIKFGEEFSLEAKSYIKENISSFIIDFDNQDLEGINQIIRLPYFHGMIKDIIEVKYV
ncbi:MAG: hypothetical protein M1480_15250 [Bacteroidetes bacterium]|nr:hypothetical protein [Bacteroidota bacterium]